MVPPWEERAWQDLVGGERDSGAAPPSPALLRGDRTDLLEVLRLRRLWVIGADGRPADWPADLPRLTEPAERVELGAGVSVARFDLPEPVVLRRISEELERVGVRRGPAGGELTPCPWRGDRHRCGRQGWLDVRVETRDVFHRDASWVYAHPGPPGEVLELRWELDGTAAAVVLRGGFTQAAVRHAEGEVVHLEALLGDELVATLDFEPHVYLASGALIRLGERADRPTELRLRVRTEEWGWRELMVQVDQIREVPPALETWLAGGGA